MTDKEKFHDLIKKSKRITFFTGAGISVDSGIPDIRGDKQRETNSYLIRKYGYSYEEIVSRSFFNKHTDIFYDYFWNEMNHKDAQPNKAHLFIAELQKDHYVNVVTQNIDGLHEKAGSKIVINLHGNANMFHCTSCSEVYSLSDLKPEGIPHCRHCGGIIKPDVVLFEEPLDTFALTNGLAAIRSANLIVVIGSSLQVYPAAGLLYEANCPIVIINKNPTPFDNEAELVIHDSINNLI